MEECESLDSEMTELQELASDAVSQDDENEIEELHNRYFLFDFAPTADQERFFIF